MRLRMLVLVVTVLCLIGFAGCDPGPIVYRLDGNHSPMQKELKP